MHSLENHSAWTVYQEDEVLSAHNFKSTKSPQTSCFIQVVSSRINGTNDNEVGGDIEEGRKPDAANDDSQDKTSLIPSDVKIVPEEKQSTPLRALAATPRPQTIECGHCEFQRPYNARHCYYCGVCVEGLGKRGSSTRLTVTLHLICLYFRSSLPVVREVHREEKLVLLPCIRELSLLSNIFFVRQPNILLHSHNSSMARRSKSYILKKVSIAFNLFSCCEVLDCCNDVG